MATLYTNADSNIRKTWLYLTMFLVFVIGFGWIFSRTFQNPSILFFAVIISIAMSVGSYWYSDKLVLAMTKAKPIKKKDNPELYRLVENLCITAGLPLPKIYVMPESQVNAFATGRDSKHAVVAVTQGLLDRLERAELEGVIAHELSHIGNKDMLLSTVIVVLVGFVSLVSDWFLRMSFWGGGRNRDREQGNAGAIIALVGIVFAILSPIIATLIQLAISRKREFLADASGALLTRYPDGLARALEKIALDKTPARYASNATAHLYFANPFKSKGISGFFMTHPPIEQRIKALRDLKV